MARRSPKDSFSGPGFAVAADLEIIALGEDQWLLHSATAKLLVAGAEGQLLINGLLPLLQAGCSWSRLAAAVPAVQRGDLRALLDKLLRSGVVRRVIAAPGPGDPLLAPLLKLLSALDIAEDEAQGSLARTRVAIFGLEGAGAHAAVMLAQCGVRHFVLCDPFPCQPGNVPLLPVAGTGVIGRPRQELVAERLRAVIPAAESVTIDLGPAELSAENVAAIVGSVDCVLSCFDRGFAACHFWVNRAALARQVPALYAETAGQQAWAGPLVLAGVTACYMCYRMRAIACAVDSNAALAYEQYLDQQRQPRLHTRAIMPSLMPQIGGVLATAVLQVVLGLPQPVLAGQVQEYQALTLLTTTHTVLCHPDCPDCGGSILPRLVHPDLHELRAAADQAADLLGNVPALQSGQCGIVREAGWYRKDAAEPALPFIYIARLADHRFRGGIAPERLISWGKGMTRQEAIISAFGEALERYSAEWLPRNALLYARRGELDGPSLAPPELGLYAPDQYRHLPYAPYRESSVISWVRGRSLVSGQQVYLPALGVALGYQVRSAHEYLFQATSSGCAGGANLGRAILAATCEVLERDAFMITWLARLAAPRVDPLSHPDAALRDLCTTYRRRGVEILLWRLPVDHGCAVFLALGLQRAGDAGPAHIAALGADPDPARAARKAILEVGQLRPTYCRNLRQAAVSERLAWLAQDPQRVSTMHDHGLLYCSAALRPSLAWLLDQTPAATDWTPAAGGYMEQLEGLVEQLRASGSDLLYYNLSAPELAARGLATARVIVPGCQPIAFGAQEQRLGGRRLYELPYQLGLAPARLTRQQLNPMPHPLA